MREGDQGEDTAGGTARSTAPHQRATHTADDTDELVRHWSEAVPEIDPRVERVVDRLMISAKYLEQLAARLSAPHELQYADYEILARLYWIGPPHRLRPSQLAAGTLAPPTSITSRLDRLQRRGMLRRVSDPKDRRVLAAELTDEGRALFERIVAEQATEERALFEQLDDDQLHALDTGLRALMGVLHERLGPAPRRINLALSQTSSRES
ncbi:MarR family transcriptional regulator [Streptomyces sp. NPDC005438]|uniref:MarR family winged helix-turn-helix transcriptional regulator n=1 Tax=Streptomyces sp. NPDC005438 TaxID=3156880 RepID=UPI0033AC417B